MSQEEFESNEKGEQLSEQDAAVVKWLQEQGFAVKAGDRAGILEAYTILKEERQPDGGDIIAGAPSGLEDFVQRLQNPGIESREDAELPLKEMAEYLERVTTVDKINPNDRELMKSIYINLKNQVRGASGTFDTHPATDPLYDLPVNLADAFEALIEEDRLDEAA